MRSTFDQDITAVAAARWAAAGDARLAEIMPTLVRHLHDFAREVEMNHHRDPGATPATVLGPFHIEGSPTLHYGANMADGISGLPLYITGVVRQLSGRTVDGAVLDVWQADAHGIYEGQLDDAAARLRGKYTSQAGGAYCVQTIAPLGYSIPMDGPVGELISRTDVSHFRPAHVHFLITAPGYEPLITHLFEKGAPYLDADAVFGTKPELVVEFERRRPGPTPDGGTSDVPWLHAQYDFVLQPTRAATQPMKVIGR
ncbi:hypothetical protein [Mycolicibacterium hippocampi]|uniref:dioxygenase family protein n=1 Tax=Mycolicibacterium hippocampi TaxID=659824 RepID=UPI0035126BD2